MTDSAGHERVRASDAEREEFATAVREAVGEGRLSLAEGEERLGQIYEARYRDELPPLLRDLPGADQLGESGGPRSSTGPGSGVPEGRGPCGPGPWGRGHGRGYPAWAGARTPDRPSGLWWRGPLGRHTAFVTVVAAALVGIWAISATHFFWPAIPLFFLTMGLVRHARRH